MANLTYGLELDDFEPLPNILTDRGLRYESIAPTDEQLINLTMSVTYKQIGLNHVKPPSDLLFSRNLGHTVLNDYNPHSRLIKKHLNFTRQTIGGLLVGDSWSATFKAFENEEENANEYQEAAYKTIDDIDPTYWPFLYPKYLDERYQDLIPRKLTMESDDRRFKTLPQTPVTTRRRQDVLLPQQEINLDYWKYLFSDLYETFGVYPDIIRVSHGKIAALLESFRQNESLLWQAEENLDSILIRQSLSTIEEADLKDLEMVIRLPKRGVVFSMPKKRTQNRFSKKTSEEKRSKLKLVKTATIAKTPTAAAKSKNASQSIPISTTATKPLSKREVVPKPAKPDIKLKSISKAPERVTTVSLSSHPDTLSFGEEDDLLSETLDYSDDLSTPESEREELNIQRILQGVKRRHSLEDTLQLADQKVREFFNEPPSPIASLQSIPRMGSLNESSEYDSDSEGSALSKSAMDRFLYNIRLQDVDPAAYLQHKFRDEEFLDEISEPEWYDEELDEVSQHTLVDLASSDSDTIVVEEVVDSIVRELTNRAAEGVTESEIIEDVIEMVQEVGKNSPDPNFAMKVVQELVERTSDGIVSESQVDSEEGTLQNTVIELVHQIKDLMEQEPAEWESSLNLSAITSGNSELDNDSATYSDDSMTLLENDLDFQHETSSNEDLTRETMPYSDELESLSSEDDLINETMPYGDEFDDLSMSEE